MFLRVHSWFTNLIHLRNLTQLSMLFRLKRSSQVERGDSGGKNGLTFAEKTLKVPGIGGNNSAVECNLAKVEVAGSNPVSRSRIQKGYRSGSGRFLETLLVDSLFRWAHMRGETRVNLR